MFGMTDPVNLSTYQLAQLHRYAGIGFLSSLANALIVIAFFWNQVEQPHLLAWLSAVVIVSFVRLLYARKHQRDDRINLASGSGTLLLITLANGLIWGILALLLYAGIEEPYQIFLILILSVASASALPWYIAAPCAYILYLASVLVPMTFILITSGSTTGQLMALMLLVFAGTLAITAHTMHQGLMESLYKHCGYQTLASTDILTQLPNRGSFDETLVNTWKRAANAGLSLSVIMIDVDNFKKYNDFYGHQEGDHCLKEVARALGDSVRRAGDNALEEGMAISRELLEAVGDRVQGVYLIPSFGRYDVVAELARMVKETV